MYNGNCVIRCWRNGKAHGAVVNWPESFVDISGIGAIEKK
jgi:hypothetical protein